MGNDIRTFRSRILQYFPKECLKEIKKLIYNNRVNDINEKVQVMMSILDKYNVDFDELGTGTNRTAIFIDGYVFKIALDKWGIRDNEQEFTLSQELQPYVIKVYECNSIIMACEYVVTITREEFAEHKPNIRRILKDLSKEYLLGDVGTINKNFTNIGYRDSDEIVILDFAYIYRVIGDEMICDACNVRPMLDYTPDYDKLTCPHCRKQFTFIDIRRRISKEMETRELEISKNAAYSITSEKEDVVLNAADIEVDDKSQPNATFKFNLGDFVTYRSREEIEMSKNGREIDTFINIDNNPAKESRDDMLDEIEFLMNRKRQMANNHSDFEEKPIEKEMTKNEHANSRKTVSVDMPETEIVRFDNICELSIKYPNNNLVVEDIKFVDDNGYKMSVRNFIIEHIQDGKMINISSMPSKLLGDTFVIRSANEALKGINVNVHVSEYSTRQEEQNDVEEYTEEQNDVEEYQNNDIIYLTSNPDRLYEITDMDERKGFLDPPESISMQMMMDEDIAVTLMEPSNEREEEIKRKIEVLFIEYLDAKSIKIGGMDLAIDISFTDVSNQTLVTPEEVYAKYAREIDEKDESIGVENMYNDINKNLEKMDEDFNKIPDISEVSEEELREMYSNH